MEEMKKVAATVGAIMTIIIMCISFSACGGESSDKGDVTELNVIQQYGMAYAPLKVMEEQKLVEKNYDGEVAVNYSVLNSGGTINDAFVSGDADVGAMGVAPAITGVMSGVPYKICTNVSSQPHMLMTNDADIKTLKDIEKDDKIALVNIGSIQHILLAMSCEEQLGDAHALDNNLAPMAHPDGMTSLLSGDVDCQVTTSPYVFKEADQGMTEVEALKSVWPEGNSFIVAVASTELQGENPELYQAVVDAFEEAILWLNDNKEEAAELLCTDEEVDAETMLSWLNDPACSYSTELKGVMDMAKFMDKNGFLEVEGPASISDLAYDNVKGE